MRTLLTAAVLAGVAGPAGGCDIPDPSAVAAEGSMRIWAEDVTVARGGDARFVVHVERHDADGAVYVRFANLPAGVTVPDGGVGILTDAGDYTVKARGDAALVDGQMATVTATGPGHTSASATFAVTVVE